MSGLALLLGIGIVIGSATFLVAAFKARAFASATPREASGKAWRDLRGAGWIGLAACGALYAYTSIEFLARLNEQQAEMTRRKTIVASLDQKMSVYRSGLMKLNELVSRDRQAGMPADQLAARIESILADIRNRERLF